MPTFASALPKIGSYICFQAACSFVWCDEKWWYQDPRDLDWDVFRPTLESFNNKQKALFIVTIVLLDESMFAWKPKTSKHGGLPDLTFKPRTVNQLIQGPS